MARSFEDYLRTHKNNHTNKQRIISFIEFLIKNNKHRQQQLIKEQQHLQQLLQYEKEQ